MITIATEIEYLRKHGESGRLSYVQFRKLGIPLGSGSIESSIRRIINDRMKSNGMFWLAENAETMLQLRCQVMSDRWDESVAAMRNMNRKTSHGDWRWTPRRIRKLKPIPAALKKAGKHRTKRDAIRECTPLTERLKSVSDLLS